ncbi:RND family efflux transporter [Parvularcula bermudensis HTCC2503]|uniref:RND family efflux transporter n=1 Tax=Parvularcula bermudensis (strain ATCC BAA-594 / HTCC2503 / KCTC 12087) TaxID=314260 RepID=E0TBB1_PARBH|nr:efflux RND transporter permease subunit [Parvularcula bermudensis]ADM08315.1 RND family efflux transporter [Parvularcula bermudensis HTCC2503]
MNGFVAWWARNSVAANLLMVLILVAGMATFLFQIEREVFPTASLDQVNVSVSWPGASPRDVEEQIVLRIEEAVSGLDNVKEISAQAREGSAQVTVEMEDGADYDSFLNLVKARVDGVSNLPPSSFPPVVSRPTADTPITFVSVTGDPAQISEVELNRLARRYRDELAQIPFSSPLIEVQGYQEEEVAVEITESALRRYGLTFDEVAAAIGSTSVNRSMGEIRTTTGNIPIATRQLADTADEFEALVIRRNQDGSVVRVGDVATVTDGFAERNSIFRIDGKPARLIEVLQPETVNIVNTSRAISDWIDEKQSSLPPGVELKEQYTLAELYFGRMKLVSENAVAGLILVLIILFLFLRPTVAIWVSAGIGISFIGTFIFLPMVDVSLNMLSLFAMLLVIGIVVDDALVVGESIHRQTEIGKQGLDAAVLGTQIVLKPVVFAVLTTMIAFSPFLLIGGVWGDFTKHIAWTIILALTFSLIESFLILPAHLAHLSKPKSGGLLSFQGKIADALVTFGDMIYRPVLQLALASRYVTVAIFLGLFAVSVALLQLGYVKFQFQPDVEQRLIMLTVDMQSATPMSRTEQVLEQVETAIEQLDQELLDRNGQDTVLSATVAAWPGWINVTLIMSPSDARDQTLGTISERLRTLIGPVPDSEDISLSTNFANDGGDRFIVGLQSADIDELSAAVTEVKAFIGQFGELYDVGDSLQSAQDELVFELKPGAERFGLSIGEVSRQVRQAFYGEEAQRLPRNGQDVRVMVRYPLETRENFESLSSMRIRLADGREIPLSAVADYRYGPAVRRIDRVDRERSVRVWSRVREGADAGPIRADFYSTFVPQLLAKYPSVEIKRRGNDEEQREFQQNVTVLYGLALFCMYMLLAIAFSSYFQPLMIMSAIPFGFMGALFGHLLLGENFAMFSIFGICAAGGVVVNDNLVLVDYVNRLRREGVGAAAALVEAGVVRFRPILLTSVTTFVGLVPILLEDSYDAKFLRPMVIALAFGVLFALFVTLIFVPALYAVGVDIARFYRGLWTGEDQPRLGHEGGLSGPTPHHPEIDDDRLHPAE